MTGTREARLVDTLDREACIRDQLEIVGARLSFAGEIVAEEDRVGDVEREYLQSAEMDLTSAGEPDLDVGEAEAEQGQDSQAALRQAQSRPRSCSPPAITGNWRNPRPPRPKTLHPPRLPLSNPLSTSPKMTGPARCPIRSRPRLLWRDTIEGMSSTTQPTVGVPASDLTSLMNVGKAVAAYFARAGITRTDQLRGRDPLEIFETMCEVDRQRHDPCLLDTIMSAVDQANGNPARPWWTYTPHRKQLLNHR